MKLVVLALMIALGTLVACDAVIVDLGRTNPDAAVDARPDDASPCRCRIMDCRDAGDCTLTGGVCGADFFCVGDFGSCSTDAMCQAQDPDAVCTQGTDSIAACGS